MYHLKYKNKTHVLRMIPIIGPIIDDHEGHDKLVSRYNTWGKCQNLCRYCDVPFESVDNPFVTGKYTKQKVIVKLHTGNEKLARKKLGNIYHHYVPHNAFYGLDMGGDTRGIHGICPAEILHTVRLGIFKYAVKYVIEDNKSSLFKTQLNAFSQQVALACSHQSDRDVPRTQFISGISSLS